MNKKGNQGLIYFPMLSVLFLLIIHTHTHTHTYMCMPKYQINVQCKKYWKDDQGTEKIATSII